MHMAFLSRGFKNLQWYGMTKVLRSLGSQDFFFSGKQRENGFVLICVLICGRFVHLFPAKSPLPPRSRAKMWKNPRDFFSFFKKTSARVYIFPPSAPALLTRTGKKSYDDICAGTAGREKGFVS